MPEMKELVESGICHIDTMRHELAMGRIFDGHPTDSEEKMLTYLSSMIDMPVFRSVTIAACCSILNSRFSETGLLFSVNKAGEPTCEMVDGDLQRSIVEGWLQKVEY